MDMLDRLTDPIVDVLALPAVAGLLGIVLLVAAARAWSGRWRRWARSPLWSTMPIHAYPGLGLILIGFGLRELLGGPTGDALAVALTAFGLFAGALYLLAAIFAIEPRWATPRWFHDADRTPDVRDEVTAALALATELGQPRHSLQQVRSAFDGQPQLHRWGASLVLDPHATQRDHAFNVAGTLSGRLRVYPTGLGFHPAAAEERLRRFDGDTAEAVLVAAADLRTVRTVPRGADPDGRPVPHLTLRSRFHRSPYRRLVLDTIHGTYLFELWDAAGRADELADRFDVERGPDA